MRAGRQIVNKQIYKRGKQANKRGTQKRQTITQSGIERDKQSSKRTETHSSELTAKTRTPTYEGELIQAGHSVRTMGRKGGRGDKKRRAGDGEG